MITRDRLMTQGEPIENGGTWWGDFESQTILSKCHYAGARDTGTLTATEAGIDYITGSGAKGHCPWSNVSNIEVAESNTRFGRPEYARGLGRDGLVLVECRQLRPRHILTITDTRGERFHFVAEGSPQSEMTRVLEIIDRLRTAGSQSGPTPRVSRPAEQNA
jgi:hypothetical protein